MIETEVIVKKRKIDIDGFIRRGIKSAEIDAAGHLILELTDGSSKDMGKVTGDNGVGIASISQTTKSAEDGGKNEIKVALDNGKEYTFTILNGSKGDPGVSPVIELEETDDGYKGTIVDVKGKKGFVLKHGVGKDGVSPQLRINASTNEWEISVDEGVTWKSAGVKATGENGGSVDITNVEESDEPCGENIVTFNNGKKLVIKNGADGPQGSPGISPSVTVKEIENGHRVTITDKDHVEQSFDIPNGKDAPADAVLYTKQTLTDEQKTQTRENIGAQLLPLVVTVKDGVANYSSIEIAAHFAKGGEAYLYDEETYLYKSTGGTEESWTFTTDYVLFGNHTVRQYEIQGDKMAFLEEVTLSSSPEVDIPEWAQQPEKPTYTAEEVGALPDTTEIPKTAADVNADPSGTAGQKVLEHNVSTASHNDIRLEVSALRDKLNAFLDIDDTTKDQVSEIIALIEDNRDLIDSITTGKVSVSDIVNNLTTNVANKPLSAAQGVALKALIDAITVPTNISEFTNDAGYIKSAELDAAVDAALAEAKESGEFDGEDGTSVTIEKITESTGSGGENITTFSDGNTLTVMNGKDGGNGIDAYTYATNAGYTGTEAQFAEKLAKEVPDVVQNTGNDEKTTMSQAAVTAALEKLTTLPYGGSKEWLENNGDTTQLYQIDGYVWGYIESDGWTRSGTQFLVVSSENEMTNKGGTAYLLRSGDEGTAYSYTEASGDADVAVYDSLPETANEGDIIAVGGRKYKAALSTEEVANYTNLADPTSEEWLTGYRLSSSGTPSASEAATCSNFIPCKSGDILRVKGIDMRTTGTPGGDKICVYNSSKAMVFVGYPTNSYSSGGPQSSIKDIITYEDGISTFTLFELGDGTTCTNAYTYVRVSFRLGDISPSDVVITLNEEIVTKTVTTVNWTDIGEYVAPVEGGWNATDEAFDIIDSLSSTANSGDNAVYSGDGYLYSYIRGSAWMQTSKYSAPTLSIDGKLSFTSPNAVQNKAVASAIDAVQAKVNSNTEEINALNAKIANIETESETITIPTFWEDAVNACICKIKALQLGRNCITFPFFSDNHQRNGYAGILIFYIMKECNVPFCFFGGDSIGNGYIDSEETMIAQDKAFDTIMSYIPNGRFCRAVGNHDGYWNVSSSTGDENHYSREQIYDLFLREESIAQNKHFGDDGTHYYVDDIASKTRFVVMNTNRHFDESGNVTGDTFDSVQLAWLQNEALNFTESGWNVVFIGHAPITNNFHSEMTNATTVQTIIDNYNKGTATNKADVVGWFAGHIHRDRIYWTDHTGTNKNLDDQTTKTLSFPTITITSDHTGIAYDDATKHTVASDDQSHAIDFVTINKTTRTVNITRLGIGEDRSYTY